MAVVRWSGITRLLFVSAESRAGDALITDPTASANYISFIYGFPDSDSLPAGTVAETTHRVLTENPVWSLQYGTVNGQSRNPRGACSPS